MEAGHLHGQAICLRVTATLVPLIALSCFQLHVVGSWPCTIASTTTATPVPWALTHFPTTVLCCGRSLAGKYNMPMELAYSLASLALYDVIIYCDDSGSMAFEENGERIQVRQPCIASDCLASLPPQ